MWSTGRQSASCPLIAQKRSSSVFVSLFAMAAPGLIYPSDVTNDGTDAERWRGANLQVSKYQTRFGNVAAASVRATFNRRPLCNFHPKSSSANGYVEAKSATHQACQGLRDSAAFGRTRSKKRKTDRTVKHVQSDSSSQSLCMITHPWVSCSRLTRLVGTTVLFVVGPCLQDKGTILALSLG